MYTIVEDGVERQLTQEEYNLQFPTPSNETQSLVVRLQRDMLLKETDWWAVADRTMTQAEIDYRQALRDVPEQAGFPENVTWPTKPE